MRYLSLLLLGPWLVLLAWVYWSVWKRSRISWRYKVYDVAIILIALAAAGALSLMAYDDVAIQTVSDVGRESGGIWKQVMPALYGYGAFAAVMIPAVVARLLFRKPR
ncbi:hypothetical protein DWU98_16675 [Dyella monticola]|uniref:Uncharacterized protein n=1 Tax=Dyella monticola TaxID=1927958 RepID=A0A370WU72_9GAMM|nr:hypothetical protein [Dyella monticola]RDS79699.1 hypothetical protein DWU98_16675 [Dyella monticola]